MEALKLIKTDKIKTKKEIDPYANTSFLCLKWATLIAIPMDTLIGLFIWFLLKQ